MSEPDDEAPTIHLGMICDHGEKAAFRARALMDEVMARLSRGSETFRASDVTAETFLYDVLMSLAHDLSTSVERIGVDMWFGITATRLTSDNLEQDIVVQCDRPEYGLAAIWKHLADEKGLAPLQ